MPQLSLGIQPSDCLKDVTFLGLKYNLIRNWTSLLVGKCLFTQACIVFNIYIYVYICKEVAKSQVLLIECKNQAAHPEFTSPGLHDGIPALTLGPKRDDSRVQFAVAWHSYFGRLQLSFSFRQSRRNHHAMYASDTHSLRS